MKGIYFGTLVISMLGLCREVFSQCTAIRQQRNITFNTNGDCAPVDVTDYTITYFFNTVQAPSDIVIHFEWNDPANSFDEFGIGDAGFIAGGGNTEFTATGTFSYPEDENCLFEPVAYVIVDGIDCETSEQTQLVSSWARDNNFGGNLAVDPGVFNVCFGNAVVAAQFIDNSEFNCNINVEPDNPNRQDRYTQFVYGTNHDDNNSIRNLTLTDGGGVTQSLTDNTGALIGSTTLGGVTAGFFGDIVHIPFPADIPDMMSLPIDAPADLANLIGNQFEITLYNWNVCNPFNGNANNPNYVDAVELQAYVSIVQEPIPDFQTKLNNAAGPLRSVFCLNENIFFENLTVGGFDYVWNFFDDNLGTTVIGTSNQVNPTFSYNTAGEKLIRLTASNANVQGSCEVAYDAIVMISPDAVAGISVMDPAFTTTLNPAFCQDASNSMLFEVGFRDVTMNIEPVTQWRWELFDENGDLFESLPAGVNTYSATSITDFTRTFSTPGSYLVRLIAQNQTTGCETMDEIQIDIYPTPTSTFTVLETCEGQRSIFSAIPDSIATLIPRINNDRILFYDWDFSYDGVTFNQELRRTDNEDFDWFIDGNDIVGETEPANSIAGIYEVALRITTENASCTSMVSQAVTINSLPEAQFTSDYNVPICPFETITFINQSGNSGVVDYELIVKRISDNDLDTIIFGNTQLSYTFLNSTVSSIVYEVFLRSINEFGCEQSTLPIAITVLPSSTSGFVDLNYDPLSNNCSVWNSTFQVSSGTQALDPDLYTWTIRDAQGVLSGFPITKVKGQMDFHLLDYEVVNDGRANQVYLAELEVTKTGVCVDDAQFNFQINPQPSALFSVEEIDSCEFKIFRFEALQKGLVQYDWQFDPVPDEILQQNEIQFIRYERPAEGLGNLSSTVSLQTTNLANCISNIELQNLNTDVALQAIGIDFSMSQDTLQLPDNELFLDNNTTNNPSWLYHWDFGDGQTFSGFDPIVHEYASFGIYNITLTVTNEFCERSLSRSLIILPTVPLIDFEADILEGCQPLTVNFTNMSEFAVPGTFVWDFGDGTKSNQDNPSYTYFRNGVYSVQLIGENELGTEGQRTKQFYIEVFEAPSANFAINPRVVFIPNQKTFFSNLSTSATSFEWFFGDGNTSSEFNPSHSYTEEGNYDISLVALNDFGCTDTLVVSAGVEAIKGGEIRAPNAFTPNSSGPSGGLVGGSGSFNDVFIPKTDGVTSFKMLIFNKWGQLLFESNNINIGWDGYYKDQLMPMDVYVYRLELGFSDGRKETKLGDVTLVR